MFSALLYSWHAFVLREMNKDLINFKKLFYNSSEKPRFLKKKYGFLDSCNVIKIMYGVLDICPTNLCIFSSLCNA